MKPVTVTIRFVGGASHGREIEFIENRLQPSYWMPVRREVSFASINGASSAPSKPEAQEYELRAVPTFFEPLPSDPVSRFLGIDQESELRHGSYLAYVYRSAMSCDCEEPEPQLREAAEQWLFNLFMRDLINAGYFA